MEPKNTQSQSPKTYAELVALRNWGVGSQSSNPTEDRYFAGGIPSPEPNVTLDDTATLAEMFRTRDTTPVRMMSVAYTGMYDRHAAGRLEPAG
jgi:hypothetical protein